MYVHIPAVDVRGLQDKFKLVKGHTSLCNFNANKFAPI
jgi:hypothetical protein